MEKSDPIVVAELEDKLWKIMGSHYGAKDKSTDRQTLKINCQNCNNCRSCRNCRSD